MVGGLFPCAKPPPGRKELMKKVYSDLKKLREMKDEDIDYSDIQETDEEFWRKAKVIFPSKKKILSIRLDEDVVEWFKAQGGRGYQTRINAVLKAYKEAHSD
jgi:uncharacterized protein (DUF4415 family)